ncbi:hypothetical protein PENTCL1PPCAC_6953, partial [Pristionchus entomophagus]
EDSLGIRMKSTQTHVHLLGDLVHLLLVHSHSVHLLSQSEIRSNAYTTEINHSQDRSSSVTHDGHLD